jgi:hypothetical protein
VLFISQCSLFPSALYFPVLFISQCSLFPSAGGNDFDNEIELALGVVSRSAGL